MTLYMHASLTPKPARLAELGDTVAWLARGMERRGLRMVRAFRTVNDDPGLMVDLWQVPDADTVVRALADARHHPAHPQAIERLSRSLDDEVLRILAPAAHCPEFDVSAGPDARYAHVVYRVAYGRGDSVWDRLVRAGEKYAAAHGWRLAGAFDTAIGDLCELYEIWQVPEGSQAEAPPAASALTELGELVRGWRMTMLVPLPWSCDRG